MATQQTGLVAGNKQNNAGGATGKSRSKFPLSYSQFQTERFAEYTPFFVQEGVSGDRLPLHSNHEVQTYTLKFPNLQSLSKKKDYFVVPMQAILPLNWEKFYTNPNIGQDVPDDCGCGVVQFWSKMRSLYIASWTTLVSWLNATTVSDADKFTYITRLLLFFENVYSAGSLMETLRISGHNWFKCAYTDSSNNVTYVGFDFMFDKIIGVVASFLSANPTYSIALTIGSNNYLIFGDPTNAGVTGSSSIAISLREALELMRDDMSYSIPSLGTSASTIVGNLKTELNKFSLFSQLMPNSDADLNLGRLWAYQLVVSHFYSNDHVDFVYSAELFRQYIWQLTTKVYGGDIQFTRTFSVNGLDYEYDYLSAHYFTTMVNSFDSSKGILGLSSSAISDNLNEVRAYFTALFAFKRSLRFLDYFTGARAYPLAVGNASVAVNNNAVDIIDLSRSSMMTKFLQAVNRSGRKFSAYMQELFGKTPAYDYHNPMYLAHTSDLVGAEETENTGAAQVTSQIAVTSRFKATSSRYAFEFEPDRDCIVIGLSYYDLPRVYARATDAQNFYVNRFDMFNPYLQFIGDQPISEAEIGTDTPDESKPFAYTNRHMEYKQRYNSCAGGFCVSETQLDKWIFPADTLRRNYFHNISPSFIRSFNSELDRFYQSLTGYSLGTYFHFIVRYDNRQDASRPMAYNPTISI